MCEYYEAKNAPCNPAGAIACNQGGKLSMSTKTLLGPHHPHLILARQCATLSLAALAPAARWRHTRNAVDRWRLSSVAAQRRASRCLRPHSRQVLQQAASCRCSIRRSAWSMRPRRSAFLHAYMQAGVETGKSRCHGLEGCTCQAGSNPPCSCRPPCSQRRRGVPLLHDAQLPAQPPLIGCSLSCHAAPGHEAGAPHEAGVPPNYFPHTIAPVCVALLCR